MILSKKGLKMRDLKKIILGIVVVLVLVLAIVFATRPKSTVKETKGGLIKENHTLTVRMLSSKFSDISELASQEFWYKEIMNDSDNRKVGDFNIPFTESRRICSYEGKIKAGIDFKKIDVKVDNKAKTINVVLPKSKILSNEIDFDSFKLYDEKNSIFTPLKMEKTNNALKELKSEAEKEAKERKIFEKADKQNVKLFKRFISSIDATKGYKVTVSIEE